MRYNELLDSPYNLLLDIETLNELAVWPNEKHAYIKRRRRSSELATGRLRASKFLS